VDLAEAVHTQTLIDWLTNPHQVSDAHAAAARDAAAWLADRAHHLTHAGPTAAQVLLGWDNLLEGCFGCPDCTPNPNDDQDQDVDDQDEVEDPSRAEGLSDDDVRQLVADGWLAPVAAGEATAPTGAGPAVARVGGDVAALGVHDGGAL
jgi:hypothetical protein